MLPRPTQRTAALALAAAVALATLAGCGGDSDARVDPDQVDATQAPDTGTCRVLTPADLGQPSDATRTVPCSERHTAETFAVGQLPTELDEASYDSAKLSTFAFETCSSAFQTFLGADESTVMRSVVSWVWFRPSERAWDEGARWYRCDVVGGSAQSEKLLALPTTARDLLAGRPDDAWMACVDGPSVQGAAKVPCTTQHRWRAVTTIKVGDPGDAYPGDAKVASTTSRFCSSSVAAWLGYPKSYDYGYTFFHRAEWDAGNRRSVCWAATAA